MSREARLARAGAVLLRGLFATLRVEVRDLPGILSSPPPGPLIYAFWHNRILAVTAAFLRVYPPGRKGVSVLTSASKDGEILAGVAAALGMGAVRGSTSRRGAAALRECLHELGAGRDIAITPDGPRGPRYTLGPGLLLLSRQTGARIAPIRAEFGRAIRLDTWDGFAVPLPFSKVTVTLCPLESVAPTASDEAFEAERKRIEALL